MDPKYALQRVQDNINFQWRKWHEAAERNEDNRCLAIAKTLDILMKQEAALLEQINREN